MQKTELIAQVAKDAGVSQAEAGKVINSVTVVRDGVEALAYLRRQEPYANARQPDMVLLDLNLPGQYDGFDVCQRLRSDPATRTVPVVIISAMDDDESRARATARGNQRSGRSAPGPRWSRG